MPIDLRTSALPYARSPERTRRGDLLHHPARGGLPARHLARRVRRGEAVQGPDPLAGRESAAMPFEIPTDLDPVLLPLAFLLGEWAGAGLGQYPTIEDFRFG